MISSSYPSSLLRPFCVHFLKDGKPDFLFVLAKSECHAVQVMFRYFKTYYKSIDMITYDSNLSECYVTSVHHFSDALYKHIKKVNYGNN